MFVVTRMPFDGGMCSRHPTTAHGTDSGILGKNFRQRICELAAHSSNSNIVFGAHGSPPTLTGPAIWPNRHCSDGFQGRSAPILASAKAFKAERTLTYVKNARANSACARKRGLSICCRAASIAQQHRRYLRVAY